MAGKGYPYDILGNIAVVKFPDKTSAGQKKSFAKIILKETSATTVLEKVGKFSGRLRKQKTRFVAGERTKEVLYKENGCVFRFNIDTSYFSPRLSNERKEIASKIKKGDRVLVMFAGVAPYSIVIAKLSKASRVYSNEINREANKYAKLNIELNKLKGRVELLPGDVKRVVGKMIAQATTPPTTTPNLHSPLARGIRGSDNKKTRGSSVFEVPAKFDVIVMPRPQLRDSFLKEAFALSKKNTQIFYYGFTEVGKEQEIVERIKEEAERIGKKIKIINVKTAGEIGPYKIRIRVDFRVL